MVRYPLHDNNSISFASSSACRILCCSSATVITSNCVLELCPRPNEPSQGAQNSLVLSASLNSYRNQLRFTLNIHVQDARNGTVAPSGFDSLSELPVFEIVRSSDDFEVCSDNS